MRTDEELFQQIELKNRSALELLYDRYEKSLYLLLTRMLPDEHRIQMTLKQMFHDIWTDPNRFPSIHGYLIAAVKQIKSQREPVR
ncbi:MULTISPECIES: hypothetical protein [Exiguobacterium]|uniref:hypothetical protein n=1 Tax=Exiguobacterium TaxID=33986 RepID=UPI000285E5DB|nr:MULTISPECIES: hypothetical protein [Exiguobacterium]AFS70657.1 Hypothetical protein Eab7_1545 [Exiguobacterium antarcticum B7]MCT4780233.1 hypothetical protein [Exiguobacterium soli]